METQKSNGLYWNCGPEDEHFWYDGTCQAKLVVVKNGTRVEHNITFVGA